MKTVALPLALALLGAAACSGTTSMMNDTQPSSAARTAALQYQATGASMSGVLEKYRPDAAGAQDLASCLTVEADYQAKMSPLLARMNEASVTMDRYMASATGPAVADMACVATAMQAEFARHAAAACALPDLDANRAEAAQHASTMASWADHQRVRYEQTGDALGMMPATSDGTWTCRHNSDGSFEMGNQRWVPTQAPTTTTTGSTSMPPSTSMPTSWPMPCGGMMATCSGPTTGATDNGTSGASPSDPVALGQRIFQTGTGVDGQPIARSGGYDGMTMMSGCASCHGFDGHGRQTMMFPTPNITYANLTDPAGMLEPDGTRGPAYGDDLIRRAVTQGIDPDNQPLSTVMPRWQLSDDDWSALVAFLKTLH